MAGSSNRTSNGRYRIGYWLQGLGTQAASCLQKLVSAILLSANLRYAIKLLANHIFKQFYVASSIADHDKDDHNIYPNADNILPNANNSG